MNFIDAHDFSVGLVLRVLGIAASTYYDSRKAQHAPSRRARQDAELLGLIDEIRGERQDRPTIEMMEENRRLRAEVKQLRAVNDVLKAASAYFASEIDPTRRRS